MTFRRPLASAARARSGGIGTTRRKCQMLPHLLAVGARNSEDRGPTRSCKGLSGERGGGGGPISKGSGSRRRHGCLRTPPGLTGSNSDKLKEMEGEGCCLACSRKALPQGWQIVGTVHGAAKRRTVIVPTRRPRRRPGPTGRHR